MLQPSRLSLMPKYPPFEPKRRTALPEAPRVMEFVAFPGVQMLDLSGPMQVFVKANEILAAAGHAEPYAVQVLANAGGVVTASSGLGIMAHALSALELPLHTLLVAGGPGVEAAAADAVLVQWLRQRAAVAQRVASVCTGAFLLARAGLLDDRRATTHWFHGAELARRYPLIRVETDPIFVRDGTIWTSAGVTAGIDLALALVEEDCGRAVALSVARHLVVFLKRPGDQAQFSSRLSLQCGEEEFGDLHGWISAHLDRDLGIAQLAEQAAMAPRSFSRRYRIATGTTPASAVEQLRLEEARRLLSQTRQPIKRIAQRCGFGTEETLRRSFRRTLGISPSEYRERFSAANAA